MLTVLDQLYAIMGEGAVSARRFAAILEEGFDAYEISAIPATADQLLLGTLGRTMAKSPRAMFILGANEGSFPHYFNDETTGSLTTSPLWAQRPGAAARKRRRGSLWIFTVPSPPQRNFYTYPIP